jgi:tRNA(His) guanylyltransferase
MNFDDLDQRMRVFETSHDHCALPGIYLVARLDGRGFTRLTKEVLKLEAPYDIRFRDAMAKAMQHLMDCGFRAIYCYNQSDEISLLFHRDEDAFKRKERKYNSILAAEASAVLSLQFGLPVAMDCRICQLPTIETLVDYFRWRQEDAARNALNGHCYWRLRNEGHEPVAATEALRGMSTSEKNEFLFTRGVNFNELPLWQKHGTGCYWDEYTKEGFNPITNRSETTQRRKLKIDVSLPRGDEYGILIRRFAECNLEFSAG